MFQGTGKRLNGAFSGSGLRKAPSPPGPRAGCGVLRLLPFLRAADDPRRGGGRCGRRQSTAGRSRNAVEQPAHLRPLYWFNYLVGQRLLDGSSDTEVEDISRSTLWAQGWDFTNRIMLGSVVVGAVLALLLGLLSYGLFRRREAMTDVRRSLSGLD